MENKILNESELLKIKILRENKVSSTDIVALTGLSVERLKSICKQKKKNV